MRSTYEAVLGTEPSYTSCHGKFIGTVDYVWFTPEVSRMPAERNSCVRYNHGRGYSFSIPEDYGLQRTSFGETRVGLFT